MNSLKRTNLIFHYNVTVNLKKNKTLIVSLACVRFRSKSDFRVRDFLLFKIVHGSKVHHLDP